jgi:phage host-nuclease inhibitor protein Gam
MRSASKIAQQRSDVARAADTVDSLQQQLVSLEDEFTRESEHLREQFTAEAMQLKELPIKPRKSDLTVDQVALVWTPWFLDAVGMAKPAS